MTAFLALLLLSQVAGFIPGSAIDAITVNSGVGGIVELSVESEAKVEAVYPAPKEQFKFAGSEWWILPTADDSAAGVAWWKPMPPDWPDWDTLYAYTYYLVLTPEHGDPLKAELGTVGGKW